MTELIDILAAPFEFGFMTRAFIGVSLIAVLSGIVGAFIMLKGLAFIGEAIAHASFGGLVGALLLGWPLQVGALIVGAATGILVTLMGRATRLKPDTSLAILFTGAFSLGVLGLSLRPSFAAELSALLVGSVLAIGVQDIYWIGAAVAATGLIVYRAFHHLVYVSFDPAGAEAAGVPVTGLQLLLLSLVALSVVVSLQAVGAVLVVALLITPAATASLFTRRIGALIAWAVAFGLIGAWVGLYISYYFATPSGATIVTVVTAQFAAGLLAQRLLRSRRPAEARAG